MTNYIFKRTILISFLGHITVFSMFSFSFGPKISQVNNTFVYFRGAILRSLDLVNAQNFNEGYKTKAIMRRPEALILDKISRQYLLEFRDYLKPPVTSAFHKEKIIFTKELMPGLQPLKRKDPTIMFYPKLPYHFALYFKDRQIVHIELSFKIIPLGERNSIIIKRKVSSGNLEADLLSMRYISRYLFIQEKAFIPNNWQTVKIDLSRLND